MPAKADEFYECEICGAVVKVKEGGGGIWSVVASQ